MLVVVVDMRENLLTFQYTRTLKGISKLLLHAKSFEGQPLPHLNMNESDTTVCHTSLFEQWNCLSPGLVFCRRIGLSIK
jgi:hypothetical protein